MISCLIYFYQQMITLTGYLFLAELRLVIRKEIEKIRIFISLLTFGPSALMGLAGLSPPLIHQVEGH